MTSGFIFSDDNKRYHTLSYHNRHTYGKRLYKAVIDAGFTCPNIDGTKGRGGCIYCAGGSGYFTAAPVISVRDQLCAELERIRLKAPDAGYNDIIAYFQAHTNTYGDINTLSAVYREALSLGVFGISVATRADCIDEERAALLSSLRVPVTVELGLQTAHDSTAKIINRCHSFEDFLKGYKILRNHNIRVCVHIIDGLPGEDDSMMIATAKVLGQLKPDAAKLQLLHVIRGTPLYEMYSKGEYVPLERERYIDLVISQLELLPQDTVIERITGDGDRRTLAAPLWSRDKLSVLGGIDRRMKELDTYQGRLYAPAG